MLPERHLVALRVRIDGRTQAVSQPVQAEHTVFVSGLAFWASLFGLSVIAGLF